MKSIKVIVCIAIAMFILWLCFWMFGSWNVPNSFKTFSFIWAGVCVSTLVGISFKLTKLHNSL